MLFRCWTTTARISPAPAPFRAAGRRRRRRRRGAAHRRRPPPPPQSPTGHGSGETSVFFSSFFLLIFFFFYVWFFLLLDWLIVFDSVASFSLRFLFSMIICEHLIGFIFHLAFSISFSLFGHFVVWRVCFYSHFIVSFSPSFMFITLHFLVCI